MLLQLKPCIIIRTFFAYLSASFAGSQAIESTLLPARHDVKCEHLTIDNPKTDFREDFPELLICGLDALAVEHIHHELIHRVPCLIQDLISDDRWVFYCDLTI